MPDIAIDKRAIAQSFGLAAPKYDSVAHFQRWVGRELLDLLPQRRFLRILDLGTGTGYFIEPLRDAHSPELMCGLDLSEGMIRHIANANSGPNQLVVGDADMLPFQSDSFDLVYSSLAIQWCYRLPQLFDEISRILAPSGLFGFSTLLNGSLIELKEAWGNVDQSQHVNDFFELKDYAVAINSAALSVHSLTERPKILEYENALDLSRELKTLGAHNMTQHRNKGLTGKTRVKAFVQQYETMRMASGYLPATYQVGFGLVEKG
jgi:malonyl-CoA O-methyltransferase